MDQIFNAGSLLTPWHQIVASWSKATLSFVAQYLNDLAFAFKAEAPNTIGRHRKIRAPAFIRSHFLVEKAKAGRIDQMYSKTGSIKGERFSGFAEDYGEGPKSGRSTRSIGANARGGDMGAKAKKHNRLMPDIPKTDDFADIKGAPNQRIAAMISIIARHPSVAPQGTFMLQGSGFQAGVYRLKVGATKGKRTKSGMVRMGMGSVKRETYRPEIERVQTFKQDITHKRLDWAGETQRDVLAKAGDIALQSFRKSFNK